MKRLLFTLAALTVAVGVSAGIASAAGPTLLVSPNPVQPGGALTVSGSADPSQWVEVAVYGDPNCTWNDVVPPLAFILADGTGAYAGSIPLAGLPLGTYAAQTWIGESASACVPFTISDAVAPPPPPAGIFLCYSKDQTVPGVWPAPIAAELLKQGYWMPYAVSGDSAGGTNLGGFHLVCNIAATQSVSTDLVGGDGSVLPSAYQGVPGLYPKVGS